MKKLLFLACFFLTLLTLHAKGILEDINLAEEKAKESYAIGMLMGRNLQSHSIEFDYTAFTEGFRAILENNETQISMNEALELAGAALERGEEKAAEEQRIIQEAFLSDNSAKPGIHVTPSGLQFEILAEGTGDKPAPNSVVKAYYKGTLIDGTEFDNSGAEAAFIPLDMVIDGWAEALQLMNVGSKYRFYMPANLAYGKRGVPGFIPQYATLIFEVELLEIMNRDDFFSEEVMEFEF